MIDFINDDLTFKPGFEQHFPEDQRDYVKAFKTLPDAIKSGLEARRDFRDRVKLPTDEDGKRKFVQEHFKDVLDKDAETDRQKKQTEADAAKKKQDEDAAKAAEQSLTQRRDAVKSLLGGPEGKELDANLELARRAMRSEHMPKNVKDLLAAAVKAESFDKVTDAQIKDVLGTDPLMAQLALSIGKLSQNGRTETGDGHNNRTAERDPSYPHNPEFYAKQPDTDPEKLYFLNRGAVYENGKYVGGYAVTKK